MPLQYLGKRGQVLKGTPRTGSGRFAFTLDKGDIKRVTTRLDKMRGKSLATRLRAATKVQGELVAKKIQQAAPVHTGTLKRSVKARYLKPWGMKATSTILIGPVKGSKSRGYHRHLVIRGTGDRSSVGGKSTNPWRVLPGYGGQSYRGKALAGVNVRRAGFSVGRMRANPFVARAARGFERQAAEYVKKVWVGYI